MICQKCDENSQSNDNSDGVGEDELGAGEPSSLNLGKSPESNQTCQRKTFGRNEVDLTRANYSWQDNAVASGCTFGL